MDESPYQQGRRARRDDKPITDCPYEFRTAGYASWRAGWSDEFIQMQVKVVLATPEGQRLDSLFSRG